MSTSDNGTGSEYMIFYIKDYALYTETEKNSPIMSGVGHDPLVHIILDGDGRSDNSMEVVGEAVLVADQSVDDWLREERGSFAVEVDMMLLKIIALKVKLVGSRASIWKGTQKHPLIHGCFVLTIM